MMKADPRDERIAELEARIDKLVDAIAKLASERPSVVYQLQYVPYVPAVAAPSWQSWVWNGPDYPASGTVTITQSALGGTASSRGEIGTMLPRPSPTMTVIG
jgi:hypothetical protein